MVQVMEKDKPDMLNLNQVAAELNISRWTVYRLIASKKLNAIKIGTKLYRVSREELDAYISRQSTLPE